MEKVSYKNLSEEQKKEYHRRAIKKFINRLGGEDKYKEYKSMLYLKRKIKNKMKGGE